MLFCSPSPRQPQSMEDPPILQTDPGPGGSPHPADSHRTCRVPNPADRYRAWRVPQSYRQTQGMGGPYPADSPRVWKDPKSADSSRAWRATCTWADGHFLILTCALVTSPPSPPSALGQESFWGKGTTTSDGQVRRGLILQVSVSSWLQACIRV